jgi:hypothetical protein
MPLRLHGAKAEKLTETANAVFSESGPLHGFTAQVFTNPLSWTVPGTDTCSNGNPHARCATWWMQRRSICPMQEGCSSDWIRLRFSVDGCNASYIARRVRGDTPSMDAVGTTYMRRGISEDEHDIRRLWTALWTRNRNRQTLRHSVCQPGHPTGSVIGAIRNLNAHRSTPHANRLSQEPNPPHRTARAIVTGALVHSSMSTGKFPAESG